MPGLTEMHVFIQTGFSPFVIQFGPVKKRACVVPTDLKSLHRGKGGEKEGVYRENFKIKVESDKTVPDCFHVCRIFSKQPSFSPVQLDTNTKRHMNVFFFFTRDRHEKKSNSDQTSVQLLFQPSLVGFCSHSSIHPSITLVNCIPLQCHGFDGSSHAITTKNIIVDRMTERNENDKGNQKKNSTSHTPTVCFSSHSIIFLFSPGLLLVSYDEDEVEVELGFFWLTKSE